MSGRVELPKIGGRVRSKIVELVDGAADGLSRADLAHRFNTSIGAVAVMVHNANAEMKPHGFRVIMYHSPRKCGVYRLVGLASSPLQ